MEKEYEQYGWQEGLPVGDGWYMVVVSSKDCMGKPMRKQKRAKYRDGKFVFDGQIQSDKILYWRLLPE